MDVFTQKRHTLPMNPFATTPRLDHLVIAARSLDEGVAWCEATLGVLPGPGGEHALFGTHNRLLRLACQDAPQTYLEIIAVHPGLEPTRAAPLKRWFDLDSPALQHTLATEGPQLIHWVASVPRVEASHAACLRQGIELGRILVASRPTPTGLLEWNITVRDDGQRLWNGCLPTLIQWGDTHPASAMPDSGVCLRSLTVNHPDAARLSAAFDTIGLTRFGVTPGEASLRARLDTPAGPVLLRSHPMKPAP